MASNKLLFGSGDSAPDTWLKKVPSTTARLLYHCGTRYLKYELTQKSNLNLVCQLEGNTIFVLNARFRIDVFVFFKALINSEIVLLIVATDHIM